MDERESLNHMRWECKYHVIFIPKYRRKALDKELRRYLGEVFRRLAEQKESRMEEGYLLPDHVHRMIAIPPKYAVSQVIGYIKGKSAIHLARQWAEMKKSFGNTFAGKRRKRTSAWIKWGFGKRPPNGGPERRGRVSDPE